MERYYEGPENATEDRPISQAETLVEEISEVIGRLQRILQPVLNSGPLTAEETRKSPAEPSPLISRLNKVLSQVKSLENRIQV